MIVGNHKTFVAYRCPHCGGGVVGVAGDVLLAGGRVLKLKCPCGESNMSLAEADAEHLRLTAPCLLCGSEHRFLVSRRVFYARDLFLLNCPYSNLDIAFIGDEDKVSAALEENEKELHRLFADAGLASLSRLHQKDPSAALLPDVGVLDIIRFLVEDLSDEGKVECPCGSGVYETELVPRGVRVFCEGCGAEYIFPVNSVEAAQDFLSCDHLTLHLPQSESH